MDEYRKELRRQSELIRADKPDVKWWEDCSNKWHYNYHKNKIIELSADVDRANFHQKMFHNYVDKIKKSSNQFWSD